MQDWIRLNRQQMEQDLAQAPDRLCLSAAFLAQHRSVLPLMDRYVQGKVIDLGCGTMPYKRFLIGKATTYHTLELRPASASITYVGDIQNMDMIEDRSYDSIICLEVLEHIPAPHKALQEMYRILSPGGTVLVSVPHLSRLHEEPYDFYRFTKYGLNHLFVQNGFEVLEIRLKGGIFSFLGHQISTFCLGSVWPVPGLRQLAWFLNKWIVTWPCYGLDRVTDRSGLFALGYVGVARKPGMDR